MARKCGPLKRGSDPKNPATQRARPKNLRRACNVAAALTAELNATLMEPEGLPTAARIMAAWKRRFSRAALLARRGLAGPAHYSRGWIDRPQPAVPKFRPF